MDSTGLLIDLNAMGVESNGAGAKIVEMITNSGFEEGLD